MVTNENKPGFFDKIRYKYRLSVYRDESYEEVLNFKLSRLNVIALGGTIFFVLLIIITLIIAYTPLRELIPGYPDENTSRIIYENKKDVDTLKSELDKRDQYIANLKLIISGKHPEEEVSEDDSIVTYNDISFKRSADDSVIRQLFEDNTEYGLSVLDKTNKIAAISQFHFFPPVRGIVTNSFKSSDNHYGTDVVAGTNEVVKTTLDGTVTMATWTLETGWVIQIQHESNILSIYKHNAELLKKVGDYVKAGEPIAIIGNSGELTTGPHLHFELWHNGIPLNPEDYISF